jgi:small-conductance mechanosensitive channel
MLWTVGVGFQRLWLTLAICGGLILLRVALGRAVRGLTKVSPDNHVAFWIDQAASLATLVGVLIASIAIWLNDAARLTSVLGLVTAGVAIAAQKAVTSFAGYLVIMRGNTFSIGDRIKMGGVRGDVMALGFLQTRILEMGQPAEVNQQEDPGMWVRARQFTGRIVTITNDKLFEEPVYNFTHEFPFIWEEMHVPIPYRADRARAEAILIEAVRRETRDFEQRAAEARDRLSARYGIDLDAADTRTFWRLTDNWLEISVRFMVPAHDIREIKDRISRRLLAELDAAGISIASTTTEVTLMRSS